MTSMNTSLPPQPCVFLQGVCLCLALHAVGLEAGATELPGRLFTSPAERATIDQLRARVHAASPQVDDPRVENAAPSLTLDGVVRRSSGNSTTWVNQEPRHENGGSTRLKHVSPPASAVLPLPSGGHVELKAGQTYDHASGTVREVYQRAGAGR